MVRIVATHLNNLSVMDTHELTGRDVQSAASVLGGTTHDGHDVPSSHRQVEELRSERPPAEGALLREKVIPDRRPVTMRAGDAAGARQMPDGVLTEARADGSDISRRQAA